MHAERTVHGPTILVMSGLASLVLVLHLPEYRMRPEANRPLRNVDSETIMRIYAGDYAYEIERVLDPETQLVSGWRYNIYRVRPFDDLLESGQATSKQEAEQAGRCALARILRAERRAQP